MEKEGFKFDLETQRFIENRWKTDFGKQVREELIEGIKACVDIRVVLDQYVLVHHENKEPYSHPIYPSSAMMSQDFWVLTSDDLRGIHFYNEDFSNTRSLERKSLGYSYFYNCNLEETELACADYSYATFQKCSMKNALFVQTGGFSVAFKECDLRGASFWSSGLREPNFSGSNLSGAYFEGALLEKMTINHQTKFDDDLRTTWRTRNMPADHIPDILRSIRIAYKDAEIWDQMDRFLFKENQSRRKHILWPDLRKNKDILSVRAWLKSLASSITSGYSTKPLRIILFAFILALLFATFYFFAGTPNSQSEFIPSILESIYFSLTTFATLGYGDISYSTCRPVMRIVSTIEAWVGAITISLFVVALSRKVFR